MLSLSQSKSEPRRWTAAMGNKRTKTTRCRYSASCFTCPLPDCAVHAPLTVNRLPMDFEYEKKKRRRDKRE